MMPQPLQPVKQRRPDVEMPERSATAATASNSNSNSNSSSGNFLIIECQANSQHSSGRSGSGSSKQKLNSRGHATCKTEFKSKDACNLLHTQYHIHKAKQARSKIQQHTNNKASNTRQHRYIDIKRQQVAAQAADKANKTTEAATQDKAQIE